MEQQAYLDMAETETDHWFWKGRRHIIRKMFTRYAVKETSNIIEIGSGTGGNFGLLKSLGHLTAVEMEATAREIASQRYPEQLIAQGYLPDNLPEFDRKFDVVCMFDVLEHIEDSEASVKTVYDLLEPGGTYVLTVPAHPWLWSYWDELHHHKRRYTRKRLLQELKSGGFKILKCSHFNTILMPLVVVVRQLVRMLKLKEDTGQGTPNPIINSLLTAILKIEGALMKFVNFPFGVSIIAVARKPKN